MTNEAPEQQIQKIVDTPERNNDFQDILKKVLSDPNGRAELDLLFNLSGPELIDRKNTYALIAERQGVYKTIEEKSDLMKDRKEYIKLLISVANGLNSDPSYREILGSMLKKRKEVQKNTQNSMKNLLGDIQKHIPIKKEIPKNTITEPIVPIISVPDTKPQEEIVPIQKKEETPKKPNLARYAIAIQGIIETLKNIQQDRDENTGFVNTLIDDVVSLSGGESGKAIYKKSFDSVRDSANSLEASLKKIDISKLSPEEKKEHDTLLKTLETIKKMEIGDVSVLKSLISSKKSTLESINYAFKGLVGTGEGVIEGGIGMIKGVADLTLFILKYSGSWVGINSEYKKEIHTQSGKIWDFVQKEGFDGMSSQVYAILGNEMKKIGELPGDQQAEAIGKISGNVISALLLIKGTLVAGAKVSEMTGKMGRIGVLLENLSSNGLSSGERAAKLTEFLSIATKAKNAAFAIEVLLNGPAETLIGATAVKSFAATFVALKARKASEREFEQLGKAIVEEAEKQAKSIESLFRDHPLKSWFEKEGKRRSTERLNQVLKLWQENIAKFPKDVHAKIATDPEHLEYLLILEKKDPKEVQSIINALREKGSEPFLVFNSHKAGWKDPELTGSGKNPMDDAHNGDNNAMDDTPEDIRNLEQVIEEAKNGNEDAKRLLAMSGVKEEDIIKTIKKVENINAHGPLKLQDINLKTIESITDVPRTIEVAEGKYISVVRTGTTKDGKEIFTARYGIDLPNTKYPPFEGASTFVVDKGNIYFSKPRSRVNHNTYDELQKELLKQISEGKVLIEGKNPLEIIKSGKTAGIANTLTNFPDTQIFDAGTNARGEKVLLINITNKDGIGGGQLEMNLFQDNGKNVIYIGSMAKDSEKVSMTKSLEGLLPRIRDILKELPSREMPEIRYFRTGSNGEAGSMVKMDLTDTIEKYFKGNPTLIRIVKSLLI